MTCWSRVAVSVRGGLWSWLWQSGAGAGWLLVTALPLRRLRVLEQRGGCAGGRGGRTCSGHGGLWSRVVARASRFPFTCWLARAVP